MAQYLRLHSAYNPQKEAERFCSTLDGNPCIIVITEPGESYLACHLRKKFPDAKLIAVRYTDTEFFDSDRLWDAVWRPAHGNLPFFILNHLPEELLPLSLFVPWKPSDTIWEKRAQEVWDGLSKAIKLLQSLIATRQFFGKRWLKNIFYNLLFAEKPVQFNFTNKDSVFLASGPTLELFLTKCAGSLNGRFLTAASSALKPLSAHGVTPAFCIATDGGFWAAGHLKHLSEKTVLAFPLEAKIPIEKLKTNRTAFLTYGSKIETFFFNSIGIHSIPALRNGSVSGTAIELLLKYTKGLIYTAGLDLAVSKGFAHARPHESSLLQEQGFTKCSPASSFAAFSNIDSRSLNTYANWFSHLPLQKAARILRIKGGAEIGSIQTFDTAYFNTLPKPPASEPKVLNHLHKTFAEKKYVITEFCKNIQKSLKDGSFFKKTADITAKEIEHELCELVSFQNYMQYRKACGTADEEAAKEALGADISSFTAYQLQRVNNEL